MALVQLAGLSKSYGRRRAVDDVSFEVQDREVMGLLGPNGSGKTTILRMVTGYLRPSAGSVRIDGHDVRDGREARRLVGYVPEENPLYGHMRVNEYLAFAGRLRGLGGGTLARRIDAAVERLELASARDAILARLSRGYRQRVSLAQAILHGPRLLVLDEPTNGLDPRQIIEFRRLVTGLAQECAVLLTSHILSEIERIADRVGILLDGRLLGTHVLGRGQRLRLRLLGHDGSHDRVQGLLSAVPGIVSVTSSGPAAWQVVMTDAEAAERLGERLAGAGLAALEIMPVQSELETLFWRMTGAESAA